MTNKIFKLHPIFYLLLTLSTASAVFTSCGGEDNVAVPVAGISLSRVTLELAVGGSEKLVSIVSPDDADYDIEWSSSDNTKATVDANGTVTAVAAGEATITAKADDKTAACEVEVLDIAIEMVTVAGGRFTMGATTEQGNDYYNVELPTHSVTLSSFQIGKYEVTQKLWETIMGSNPSIFTDDDNLPVENVSWNDCQTFIKKLNAATGENYRLPTEAEWEYAARGGAQSQGYKYSGSNMIDGVAWYGNNSDERTHPVGTKWSNELGIYDMTGNVWEWCSDRFGDYDSGAQTNPIGATTGSDRVFRGGDWSSFAADCRVSLRYGIAPNYRYKIRGFRLVRPI
ncbi:hypothetical protein AGMMS4957_09410 [Bacteroidia bacterium]|nr:hypothetical protein AGMMS4957_09410 [Bacteroidia bacterium]